MVAKTIGLVIAGIVAAVVFMIVALLVLAAVIWIIAAAADFVAGSLGGRKPRGQPEPG